MKIKRSEFTRIKGQLPKAGLNFLKESNFNGMGGLLDAWVKGDPKTSKNFILVMVDGNADTLTNVVIFRNEKGKIEMVKADSMYQTFLTHKSLRFR
ncbi:MAG: hypothetical protein ACTSQL_07670 [Promethearchaeota archaeon]